MTGGIFSSHKWGVSATGMQLIKSRYIAKHPQYTGQLALPQTNYLVQNLNSTKFEKL